MNSLVSMRLVDQDKLRPRGVVVVGQKNAAEASNIQTAVSMRAMCLMTAESRSRQDGGHMGVGGSGHADEKIPRAVDLSVDQDRNRGVIRFGEVFIPIGKLAGHSGQTANRFAKGKPIGWSGRIK